MGYGLEGGTEHIHDECGMVELGQICTGGSEEEMFCGETVSGLGAWACSSSGRAECNEEVTASGRRGTLHPLQRDISANRDQNCYELGTSTAGEWRRQ